MMGLNRGLNLAEKPKSSAVIIPQVFGRIKRKLGVSAIPSLGKGEVGVI